MVRQWTLLAFAIGSEVTATLSLQAAGDQPAWYVVVVAGYVTAFVVLAAVLEAGMPIGIAYGIWAASGVALTAVAAAILFGEALTLPILGGIALIIAGILLVELGSHRAQSHPEGPLDTGQPA